MCKEENIHTDKKTFQINSCRKETYGERKNTDNKEQDRENKNVEEEKSCRVELSYRELCGTQTAREESQRSESIKSKYLPQKRRRRSKIWNRSGD